MGQGRAVLDELGLIEDEPGPLEARDRVLVEAQHRIGHDDDIGTVDDLVQRCPSLLRRLRDDANIEVRGEGGSLLDPVVDHRGGGDDKERCPRLTGAGHGIAGGHGIARGRSFAGSRAAGLHMGDESQRLQRFAQPHIVGEDPAEAAPVEQRQPPESLHLIGTQPRPAQFGHLGGRQVVEIGQCLCGFPPGQSRLGLVGDVLEVRPQAHVHP